MRTATITEATVAQIETTAPIAATMMVVLLSGIIEWSGKRENGPIAGSRFGVCSVALWVLLLTYFYAVPYKHPLWFYILLSLCALVLTIKIFMRADDHWVTVDDKIFNSQTGVFCGHDQARKFRCMDYRTGKDVLPSSF